MNGRTGEKKGGREGQVATEGRNRQIGRSVADSVTVGIVVC